MGLGLWCKTDQITQVREADLRDLQVLMQTNLFTLVGVGGWVEAVIKS